MRDGFSPSGIAAFANATRVAIFYLATPRCAELPGCKARAEVAHRLFREDYRTLYGAYIPKSKSPQSRATPHRFDPRTGRRHLHRRIESAKFHTPTRGVKIKFWNGPTSITQISETVLRIKGVFSPNT